MAIAAADLNVSTPMSAGFPRPARVRTPAEYERVFKQGRRTASPCAALHVLAGPAPARLGLAVSRKVDPNAVGRNRIKRVLRDSFRRMRGALSGGDYVLVARPVAAQCDNATLRAEFLTLLRRAGALAQALPPPGTAGTIAAVLDASPSRPASALPDGPSLPAR